MPVETIARPLKDSTARSLFSEKEEPADAKQVYPFFEDDSQLLPKDTFRHEDFMGLEAQECPETQQDSSPPEVEFKTPSPKGKHLEDSQCLASIASNHSQYDNSSGKGHQVEESKDICC